MLKFFGKFLSVGILLAAALAIVQVDASCMGCTLFSALFNNVALHNDNNVEKGVRTLCNSVFKGEPDNFMAVMCTNLLANVVPTYQAALDNKQSPDYVCTNVLNVCVNPNCKLFDTWPLAQDAILADLNSSSVPKNTSQTTPLPADFFSDKNSSINKMLYFFFDRLEHMMGFSQSSPFSESSELYDEARAAAISMGYGALFDFMSTPAGMDSLSEFKSSGEMMKTMMSASNATKKNDSSLKSLSIEAKAAAASNLKGPFSEILHYPLPDNDNDHFGALNIFRGLDWRGKDCNDNDATIYPGRAKSVHPSEVDYNCNGISGTDHHSQRPWKDVLCSGTKQYGLIAVGDSATAHFAIPARYLAGDGPNPNAWDDVISVVLHEGDFPQCSAYTGFRTDNCPDSRVSKKTGQTYVVKSIYERMLERNQCMFRDYQNIGVNGNSSSGSDPVARAHSVSKFVNRSVTEDHPAILILSLIGNDICSKSPWQSSWTSPLAYAQSILNALKYYDGKLPKGSHVLVAGMVDGSVLYRSTENATHPIGVPFPKVYDFLNCLGSSPCSGWLNSDPAIRKTASDHAATLSNMAKNMVEKNQFNNFQAHFLPTADLYTEIFDKWAAEGGDLSELLEPVDGFHPSAIAQALIADKTWDYMIDTLKIDIPVNPLNSLIKGMFGDQGGYV